MNNSKIYLSVIIPCYNEAENIDKGMLLKVEQYLSKKNYAWEVLIVDDGSTDGSYLKIKKFTEKKNNFHLIKNPHLGKAYAILTGMNKASGGYILFTDLDQATPITEVEKMLKFVPQYDIVVGSRKNKRKGAPFLRLMMARGFMFLRGCILGLGDVFDTQCGFKLFKGEIISRLTPKLNIYRSLQNRETIKGSHVSAGFDVEILFIAKKLKFKIKEVPVRWEYVDTRRVNPILDSVEGLLDLLKIRINEWKGAYK